jgi:hypothetical protein
VRKFLVFLFSLLFFFSSGHLFLAHAAGFVTSFTPGDYGIPSEACRGMDNLIITYTADYDPASATNVFNPSNHSYHVLVGKANGSTPPPPPNDFITSTRYDLTYKIDLANHKAVLTSPPISIPEENGSSDEDWRWRILQDESWTYAANFPLKAHLSDCNGTTPIIEIDNTGTANSYLDARIMNIDPNQEYSMLFSDHDDSWPSNNWVNELVHNDKLDPMQISTETIEIPGSTPTSPKTRNMKVATLRIPSGKIGYLDRQYIKTLYLSPGHYTDFACLKSGTNAPCYTHLPGTPVVSVQVTIPDNPPEGAIRKVRSDGFGWKSPKGIYDDQQVIPTAQPPCKDWNADKTKCLSVSTAVGTLGTEPQTFIKNIYTLVLGLSGGIALILIIVSGYRFMMAQRNPEATKAAVEQLTSAIIGLVFIILSFVLLQIIGVDILHIPGFTN